MKNYIEQFYYEGLGNIFYLKPVKFLEKRIKNDFIKRTLTFLIKLLYTIMMLLVVIYIFYKKLPFIKK